MSANVMSLALLPRVYYKWSPASIVVCDGHPAGLKYCILGRHTRFPFVL
jgi:hypothetical protein